jgi:hypothetical protein
MLTFKYFLKVCCGSEKSRYLVAYYFSGLSTFSAYASRQLYVFWHYGDSFRVNSTEIRVFEEADQVSLRRLLESHDSRALETKIGLEILRYLAHQSLERELADEQFGAFLVAPDFSESHCTGPVSVRLLHSTGGRSTLPRRLCCQLLTRGFSTRRLSCSLLSTSHSTAM